MTVLDGRISGTGESAHQFPTSSQNGGFPGFIRCFPIPGAPGDQAKPVPLNFEMSAVNMSQTIARTDFHDRGQAHSKKRPQTGLKCASPGVALLCLIHQAG
jgi:hypothetical protein